jgi:hypothetical protein
MNACNQNPKEKCSIIIVFIQKVITFALMKRKIINH